MGKKLTVDNCTFEDIIGEKGSGIYISHVPKIGDILDYKIKESKFTSLKAAEMGGAIFYDAKRPVIENSIFTNNSAPIGSDIGSYPSEISLMDSDSMEIDDFVSGQPYNKTIRFGLYD